ncbi:hypothetical protein PT276_09860 [Orbaceae bacterium ESL0721]|nr:hypothetical protein [Orbaceae bacterium ESL0721]
MTKLIFFRFIMITLLALSLTACQLSIGTESPKSDVQIDVTPPANDLIVSPPTLKKATNWETILSPYIEQLLQTSSSYEGNSVLLISDIQNRSGNYLETNSIDATLYRLIDSQNRYTALTKNEINQVKQQIGISADDKLVSRSKMIAVAKLLNADYLLFTTIYSVPTDSSDAVLSLELIYTKTGEIVNRISSSEINHGEATN